MTTNDGSAAAGDVGQSATPRAASYSVVNAAGERSPGRARDPSRIPAVLDALRRAWEASPDLRLGQLVCALAGEFRSGTDPIVGVDPFYVDDGDLLRGAERFLGRREVNVQLPSTRWHWQEKMDTPESGGG